MSGLTVAMIGALVHDNPLLVDLLDAHLDANDGELLPYVVMAEVVGWVVKNLEVHSAECLQIMEWLEAEYKNASEEVRGLIRVGGIEETPAPNKPGSSIRSLMGPNLLALDPWQDGDLSSGKGG